MYRIDKVNIKGFTRYRVIKVLKSSMNSKAEKQICKCATPEAAQWVIDNIDKIDKLDKE